MKKSMKIVGIGAVVLVMILTLTTMNVCAGVTYEEFHQLIDDYQFKPDRTAYYASHDRGFAIWYNPDGVTAYMEIWCFSKGTIYYGTMRIDLPGSVW